jgi:hypothetical protein
VVRLYKTPTEEDEDVVYQPIVAKGGAKRNGEGVREPNRANRMGVNVHTNPDVKVLWNITAGVDITKDICSCVIDCEVVDKWYENFEDLKKFIDENERRPSSTAKERNGAERVLGKWMSHQLTNYNKRECGMKDQTKYVLWTTFLEEYGEYFKADDVVWYENFVELKKFIDDNDMKWEYLTPGMDIEIHGIDFLNKGFEKICFVPLAWNFYSEIRERIENVRDTKNDVFIKYFPNYKQE